VSLTQNGALCDANGDLGPAEFEALMRQQVRLYTQRQVVETLMHGQASAADFVMLETLKIVAMDMGKVHADMRWTEGAVRGLQGEVARLGEGRGDAQADVLQGIREVLACLRGRPGGAPDGGGSGRRACLDVEGSGVCRERIGRLEAGCDGLHCCDGGGGVKCGGSGASRSPSSDHCGGDFDVGGETGRDGAGCYPGQSASPCPARCLSAADPCGGNIPDEANRYPGGNAFLGVPGPPQLAPQRGPGGRRAEAGGDEAGVHSCLGFSSALDSEQQQRRALVAGAHGPLAPASWPRSATANQAHPLQLKGSARQELGPACSLAPLPACAPADEDEDEAAGEAAGSGALPRVSGGCEQAPRAHATPPCPVGRADAWPAAGRVGAGGKGLAWASSWSGRSEGAGVTRSPRSEREGGERTAALRKSWGSSSLTARSPSPPAAETAEAAPAAATHAAAAGGGPEACAPGSVRPAEVQPGEPAEAYGNATTGT
jgi:hypothetical protein